jgi:NAD(P)-dependent dehydrogenase (short-subunit alcohol dehydrogenase family)
MDPLAPFRLDGKVAIVTGASSGLGSRMAHVLAGAGARVAVAARRLDRLEALAADLGDAALPVACDVSDDADLARLLATTTERLGPVDVLVNNAGIGNPTPAEDETPEQFRQIIGVNLNAVFVLSQLTGRQMLERGSGVIVNVASVLGLVASGQIPQASYVAAKHGVVGLTREMAAQWARRGVRVNAIAPGWFASEMTTDMFDTEQGQTWIRRKTPMGRGGNADELDGALLYLASDASTFVTGQVLAVDGGWTIV